MGGTTKLDRLRDEIRGELELEDIRSKLQRIAARIGNDGIRDLAHGRTP